MGIHRSKVGSRDDKDGDGNTASEGVLFYAVLNLNHGNIQNLKY